jgi:CheY-like chemotaxis protein
MATRPMIDLGQKRASPADAKEYFMHEEPRQRRLRILVVDDNHDGAMSLSTLLELNGHHTNTAHNGLDAVRAAASAHYDAVLLDLGMPIMDGFEAAAVLGQLRPAPVLIACSAWDDAQTRRRTANLGFAAHLCKPVPLKALEAALSLACDEADSESKRRGRSA